MNRNWIAFYSLLAGFSVAIYYFMVDERDLALLFVFIGIYAFFTLYYFLRVIYYLENKATLNELFFYVGGMFMSFLIIAIPRFLSLTTPELAIINLQFPNGSENLLIITLFSLLALPFYLVLLIITYRCFTRYQFIRWGPHSDGGVNSEFFGFITLFSFGMISSWLGWTVNDFLTFIIGSFLVMSGFIFLIAR